MRVPEMVGHRIREARLERELTQAKAGEYIGAPLGRTWSVQAVSAAERGHRDFTAEELVALAHAFDRPIAWFFQAPDDAETIELPALTMSAGPPDTEDRLIRRIEDDAKALRKLKSLRQP